MLELIFSALITIWPDYLYRRYRQGKRLGESTLDPGNPGQVKQTQKISELLQAGDNSLVLVDVTPVNRTRNFHNFSLETPEFFDDLFLRLTGDEIPRSRELYFLETPEGVRYCADERKVNLPWFQRKEIRYTFLPVWLQGLFWPCR